MPPGTWCHSPTITSRERSSMASRFIVRPGAIGDGVTAALIALGDAAAVTWATVGGVVTAGCCGGGSLATRGEGVDIFCGTLSAAAGALGVDACRTRMATTTASAT